MKHPTNERGALPVLVAILVLVLAVVVFYNVGKSHQKVTETASTSPLPSTSPVASASPTASNVLKIDDWGIRLQLDSSLANTEVIHNKQSANEYAFTTSRVEALGGNCASTTLQFGDIQLLERFSDKPIATPDGELINNAPINGYYYVWTAPSATCSGMGVKPASTIETQDRAALKSSLKTLSPISN